jgi:ankyrin repeat protein
VNKHGKSPVILLAEAANTANNEMSVRLLLKAGADPRACSINPITAAIKAKNYKVMRTLYEHGVDPNLSDEYHQSPI